MVEASLLAEQSTAQSQAPIESEHTPPYSSVQPVSAARSVSAVPPVAPPEETAEPTAQVVPATVSPAGPDTDRVADEKPAPEKVDPPAVTAAEAEATAISYDLGQSWLEENWGRLLQAVRVRNRVVEALLKSCEPMSVQGDLVTLGFYHSFHRERVDENKHRMVVEEALTEIGGRPLRVRCALCPGDRQQKEQDTEAKRREKLLESPVVSEAIRLYGAKVKDVQ
ncbi:MAG: hypothetical protein FJ026_14290 [Chloroflexi bacterium]|nr:hypothetical protein [Chloroflexota bacterium]